MPIEAKVIADSISPEGDRLTTLECTFHRFILSEFNTHRAFSRNSASSRAIPITKTIAQVTLDPAIPIVFRKERPGMSGGEILDFQDELRRSWASDAQRAAELAEYYMQKGVHKSIVNRILEPYMWHTVVVSATDYENFFVQRMTESAQPEIVSLAYRMSEALDASVPQAVDIGGWHLPYLTEEELNPVRSDLNLAALQALSVSRVAGVSYNRLGKIREIQKDFDLYQRLRNANPPHWSPFEHVATPVHPNMIRTANFKGWLQLRQILEEEYGNQKADDNDSTM